MGSIRVTSLCIQVNENISPYSGQNMQKQVHEENREASNYRLRQEDNGGWLWKNKMVLVQICCIIMNKYKKLIQIVSACLTLLYTHIDQILVNSLHGLPPPRYKPSGRVQEVSGSIGELDCHVITAKYRTHVHCIHM